MFFRWWPLVQRIMWTGACGERIAAGHDYLAGRPIPSGTIRKAKGWALLEPPALVDAPAHKGLPRSSLLDRFSIYKIESRILWVHAEVGSCS